MGRQVTQSDHISGMSPVRLTSVTLLKILKPQFTFLCPLEGKRSCKNPAKVCELQGSQDTPEPREFVSLLLPSRRQRAYLLRVFASEHSCPDSKQQSPCPAGGNSYPKPAFQCSLIVPLTSFLRSNSIPNKVQACPLDWEVRHLTCLYNSLSAGPSSNATQFLHIVKGAHMKSYPV